MEKIWSVYLVIRLIIGFFDGLSDILLSFHLFTDGHPYCGLGILAWMVLALAISFVYVLVGRCRQGDPMTCMKYMLMSLKVHTEIVSAYFQGGPSLIVQLVIVWSGVYKQDFEVRHFDINLFIILYYRHLLNYLHGVGFGPGLRFSASSHLLCLWFFPP